MALRDYLSRDALERDLKERPNAVAESLTASLAGALLVASLTSATLASVLALEDASCAARFSMRCVPASVVRSSLSEHCTPRQGVISLVAIVGSGVHEGESQGGGGPEARLELHDCE